MSVRIRDPQCNIFSFFSAEHFYVGSRSRCSLLVKAIVCYLPLWKGKFLCFYLKTANASGIFFFITVIIILLFKTMSWTSLPPLTKKEIVQFWALCWSCAARSLPGLWHYQQKMLLLKEWSVV